MAAYPGRGVWWHGSRHLHQRGVDGGGLVTLRHSTSPLLLPAGREAGIAGSCLAFAASTLRNGALGGLNEAVPCVRNGRVPVICPAATAPGCRMAPIRRRRASAARERATGCPISREHTNCLGLDRSDQWGPRHAINVTELGGTVPPSPAPEACAWTNTTPDGTAGHSGIRLLRLDYWYYTVACTGSVSVWYHGFRPLQWRCVDTGCLVAMRRSPPPLCFQQ